MWGKDFFFSCTGFYLFIYFYFLKCIYLFILLYNTVLVLPYIDWNPPWVYMCSPSWTPLLHPSPSHPSGSSWCTRPELYHALNLDWRLISHMIIYMFQCHSPISSHSCPLPQRVTVVHKLWYIYTMEYYSAIKKNTFQWVLMRWLKLEPIRQSEVSQKEKHQYSILTHIYGI